MSNALPAIILRRQTRTGLNLYYLNGKRISASRAVAEMSYRGAIEVVNPVGMSLEQGMAEAVALLAKEIK